MCPKITSDIIADPSKTFRGTSDIGISGFPDIRKSGFPDIPKSGYPDIRISRYQEIRLVSPEKASDVEFALVECCLRNRVIWSLYQFTQALLGGPSSTSLTSLALQRCMSAAKIPMSRALAIIHNSSWDQYSRGLMSFYFV